MLLDITDAVVHASKTTRQVELEKTLDHRSLRLCEVPTISKQYTRMQMEGNQDKDLPGECHITLDNLGEHGHLVLVLKGGLAAQQLVDQHTNSPPSRE